MYLAGLRRNDQLGCNTLLNKIYSVKTFKRPIKFLSLLYETLVKYTFHRFLRQDSYNIKTSKLRKFHFVPDLFELATYVKR